MLRTLRDLGEKGGGAGVGLFQTPPECLCGSVLGGERQTGEGQPLPWAVASHDFSRLELPWNRLYILFLALIPSYFPTLVLSLPRLSHLCFFSPVEVDTSL